ncbi:MAG: S9 family peptidase [Bacteroidota bacterium]|nr:S9 family peptidase [Bacteroidota bacterium]
MRKIAMLLLCISQVVVHAQTLTVEKIMSDQKWIGSSPNNINWSWDSKSVFFQWNPDKKVADSFYVYTLNSKVPVAMAYNEAQLLTAIKNGAYNTQHTQITYSYKGDLYLLNTLNNRTIRITQTEENESNPKFIVNDEWIVYNKNQNLYAWQIATGLTQQLTNFSKSPEITSKATSQINRQEQFLQKQQLATSAILRQRKQKKEMVEAFLQSLKDKDTLRTIPVGDKQVQLLQVSPDGQVITYRLYTAPVNAKNTIVPEYITESGFTKEIAGRTKVGSPQGKYEWYVYNRKKDTVMKISFDSIPGSTDLPDYVKEYPAAATKKPAARAVVVTHTYWNEESSALIADVYSQDNKDRWLLLVNTDDGKLSPVNRQRDEAWIGGPGIGKYEANAGWIDNQTFYFQSEVTGYSHLYTYNTLTQKTIALTKGNYEVQDVVLGKSKQYFYLLTNEAHPGQQNWYRIKTDGSSKEKITGFIGGYEISLSPDEKYIAYRYSYINKPWELYIQENAPNKKPVQVTHKGMSEDFAAYPWRVTKIFTITARDGQPIYARLYEPKAGTKNNAAVIFVHGAGYLQNVHYWWSNYYPREYMFNNLLADKGYTVLDIDYRGSAGYGRNWRTGIYRYMGGKDLDDEVDAAHYLVKELGIDSSRIGMYGGSYGGFMTLMALFTQPDVFKAGAALRPVTDWAHYNHGYTSNILNEPFTDSIAYARSSPINFANGLKNHLLICHGMIDVNVHFQDDVRLTQRLIELGKDNWDIAIYPMEDHGFVEPSSWTDEYKRILKLFDTWIGK